MGSFKRYITCIMTFFIPFYSTCDTLWQFYSIASPVLFTENNKLWNRRKEDFLYIWMLQCITLYQRVQKTASLEKIAFLDTHLCISNLYQQSSGIIIFLCKYYIVVSAKLIGCWVSFSRFSSQNYQRLMTNQEGKIELQKKVDRRICLWDSIFLVARPPSYVIFCRFFLLLPAFGLF